MFCGCPTTFGAAPNTQTCPVCLGMPGALPVLNRRAVELGDARPRWRFGCRINRERVGSRARTTTIRTCQGLPDHPVRRAAGRGRLRWRSIWPAADAAHRHPAPPPRGGRRQARARGHAGDGAGEPGRLQPRRRAADGDGRRARPALAGGGGRSTCKAFRAVLVYLGVCDGNMEEGSLRCDANVSLRRRGRHRARHQGRDQEPELVPQRPAGAGVRGRAPGRGARGRRARSCRRRGSGTPTAAYTRSMRSKEYAHDYRYFPEPDLVPLAARRRPGSTRSARALPELPRARRQRFVSQYGLPAYDAGVLTQSARAGRLLRGGRPRRTPTPRRVSNWIMSELLRELPGDDERGDRRGAGHAGPPGRAAPAHRRRHDQRQDRQGRLRQDDALRRGRRAPSSGARASPRSPTPARWRPSSTRCIAGNPEAARGLEGGQDGRRQGATSGQVMKATRGKANPAHREPSPRGEALEISGRDGYNRARPR